MNVLSLFNGMSCGYMALEQLGVSIDKYYSSEIDKYANQAAQALYPDTIQLGDVTQWREWGVDWSSIDLVAGGFPCQAWSMAGKQLGDKDERGMLFWMMLDIMKHVKYHNPKAHFLIENVKMKKEFEEYITTHTENALGHVHKILINSALVSAQNRNRYYWTSFKVEQPEDKGTLLKDIIEHDGEYTFMSDKFVNRQKGRKCLRDDLDGKAVNLSAMEYVKNGRQGDYIKCGAMRGRYIVDGKRDDHLVGSQKGITEQRLELRKDDKTNTLTTVQKDNYVVKCVNDNDRVKAISENNRGYRPHKNDASKSGVSELGRILKDGAEKTDTVTTSHMPKLAINDDITDLRYRKLTPRECMRLQTIPEHHIDTLLSAGISNTQLYKMTGNGWTVDVIKHILRGLS
ncbi:MAG: DNA cytosine methyltransferase [Colwellia sp.]|nr:DNA cytosine methyltransferase [Colwellia sp.]